MMCRWSSDRGTLPTTDGCDLSPTCTPDRVAGRRMSESHDVGDTAGQEAGDNGVYPNTRLEEFS